MNPEITWLKGFLEGIPTEVPELPEGYVVPAWLAGMAAPYQNHLPQRLRERADADCLHNSMANWARLQLMLRITKRARTQNISVLFLKGAAELALGHANDAFMGKRFMSDVDMLCRPEDATALNTLLQELGCRRDSATQLEIKHLGQVGYNTGESGRALELHTRLAPANLKTDYPAHFEQALWSDARELEVDGVMVLIPSTPHLLLHALCHAAQAKDHRLLLSEPTTMYDAGHSGEVLLHRLHHHMLRFLFQMQLLRSLTGTEKLNVPMIKNPLVPLYMKGAFDWQEGFVKRHAWEARLLRRIKYLLPKRARLLAAAGMGKK